MTNLGWLFVAIMIVWVAIGAYMFSLGVRQHKLEARIAEIGTAEERL